jgi:hypothetical protein
MIIGPIFFSETITAERYQELITNSMSFLAVDEQDCCRATAHTANSTMQMLREFFDGIVESCGSLDPRIYRHRISIFGGL